MSARKFTESEIEPIPIHVESIDAVGSVSVGSRILEYTAQSICGGNPLQIFCGTDQGAEHREAESKLIMLAGKLAQRGFLIHVLPLDMGNADTLETFRSASYSHPPACALRVTRIEALGATRHKEPRKVQHVLLTAHPAS